MWRHLIRRPLTEEPIEVSRSLETIVWILMATTPLILAGLFILPQYSTRWFVLLGVVYLLCISTLVLNRRGHTQLAGFVLVVGLWVFLTGAAWTAGGVGSSPATFYVMIVLIAGLLFGQRAAITTAVLCILTSLGLVLLETAGTIRPTILLYTPLERWIGITLLTAIVMGLQYLSMRRVHDALKRSRQELEERRRSEAAMRESEARFRVLAETAASVILIHQDGKYRYANPAAEAITGYSKEEILGMGVGDFLHPDYRELVETRLRARERGEDVPSRYEVKIVAKNGDGRWLDAAGNWMEFEGKPARLVTAFDITERKRAEGALQRNEDLFRAIVEDQNDMIVRWKPDGTRTFVNQAYCREFGLTPATCIGTSFYPQLADEVQERLLQRIRSLTPDNPVSTHIHENKTGSGELRWQEWTDRAIFDSVGNLVELQSTGRDITERKRAEEQLLFSREQLRALSERLRRAKEEEGVRIARELHDELGSALTSLKWSLLGLKKTDPDASTETLDEKISEMVSLVDDTINVVRRISAELRPGVLDDLGLVSAIEWQAQQFQSNTGIECECDFLVDDVDMDREQSTVVFRILQEAMTNILRHAHATNVNVVMEEEDGEIILEVTDNGRGITETEQLGAGSLGLLGMRERANSIGGSVHINGTSGIGTRLVLHIPGKSRAMS